MRPGRRRSFRSSAPRSSETDMAINTIHHDPKGPALLTGLTAAGNSQATALQLQPPPRSSAYTAEVATVAAGTGVLLPASVPAVLTITNAGANSLSVYPPSGAKIGSGSLNAASSLASGASAVYWAASPTQWYTLAGGTAGAGTVTQVSVVTANGVSGSVANATTTPAITLSLGSITPSSIVASGSISGANLS